MVKHPVLLAVAASLAVIPVAAALAQRVETFYVINRSDKLIIAVQGDAGRGWSDNWLPDNRPVSPGGDGILIRFSQASQQCQMNIRVTFDDNSVIEGVQNFCNITGLYVGAQDWYTE